MRKIISPKKSIRSLKPYTAVNSFALIKKKPRQEPHKLDWNEATLPPSPRVFRAFKRYLSQPHHLNWYPDPECIALRRELARYTGRDESEILVTNGSDAALDLIARTYLDDDDEVIIAAPAYSHFTLFARSCDAMIKEVYYENPFKKEVDKIINAITPNTRMVYIINPNNPTGVLYTIDEVIAILKKAANAIVVVDEAYYEYTMRSATPLLSDFTNLIITRSFSKALSLAGARIGYIISHTENIKNLMRLHNIKSVNTLAQVAALAALQDTDYLYAYLDAVKKAKHYVHVELQRMGIEHVITPSNFILVKVKNPRHIEQELATQGVYVRDRSMVPQLNGYLRLNIGTPKQMKKVIEIFKKVIS
ncbi:histidinol-phosphate transaminase [Candidatus Woesearchaeota archaeon]|nr:histidinol-phosphate transaminase [Candidatus Woesearchaeota archaeon]